MTASTGAARLVNNFKECSISRYVKTGGGWSLISTVYMTQNIVYSKLSISQSGSSYQTTDIKVNFLVIENLL